MTALLNAEGTVVLTFYVSLAARVMVPWQCETNPDETSSVVSSRGVLCWVSEEHRTMIGISIVGTLGSKSWKPFLPDAASNSTQIARNSAQYCRHLCITCHFSIASHIRYNIRIHIRSDSTASTPYANHRMYICIYIYVERALYI